jgi:hypothetical protein
MIGILLNLLSKRTTDREYQLENDESN